MTLPPFSLGMKQAEARKREEEALQMLLATSGPTRFRDHVEEAYRRAEVFKWTWETTPYAPPRGMTPRCAAYLSVQDDVAKGLLL